jgi:cytochrome oxidase Cu insertion factor (SCO1/SenC/PrrC family)
MIRIVFLEILLSFNSFWLVSGQSVVHGNAPDYKGQTLIFNTYSNQISNTEKPVATVKVQADGNFSFDVNVTRTEYIFCHKGIFFMYLYIVPDMDYTIKLPKFIQRRPEDKINPFFEEVKVHLMVSTFNTLHGSKVNDNAKELNFLIRTFDDYFDPYYNKYARQMYTKQPASDMDSTLKKIESTFSKSDNPYFEVYYQYRMGLLKFMSTRFKSRHISDNYFLNKPILYDNPAFMELFNRVYDKYFVYFGRTQTGKVIYDDINAAKSLSRLKITLAQDKVLSNDTLKELVILKGIHDGFYEMEFQRQALLQILDSLVGTSTIREIKNIGADIRYKITRLLAEYPPPPLKLLNQDSVWTSLDKFKGSFVYLVFGTTQNYACLKEFQMLKKIQDKHPNLLKVVVVSADEKFSDIRMYARKSQLKWTFLYYDNNALPDVLKEYDIRTVPTCFLIDKEGKLAISPAPLPSENFEGYLFNYLKAKKIL